MFGFKEQREAISGGGMVGILGENSGEQRGILINTRTFINTASILNDCLIWYVLIDLGSIHNVYSKSSLCLEKYSRVYYDGVKNFVHVHLFKISELLG